MRRQSAYDERILEEGKTKPYVDPSLTSRQHTYESLISEICLLHIVDCTHSPTEYVRIFVIKRKDDKQRLIIDCRPTNQHFKKSPNMPIGGAAAWSTVRVPDGETLYCAQYDVRFLFLSLWHSP